jgi:hypothetical protein
LQRLRIHLGRVEHALRAFDAGQQDIRHSLVEFFLQRSLNAIDHEVILVRTFDVPSIASAFATFASDGRYGTRDMATRLPVFE